MSVTVYGENDDIVHVQGDINVEFETNLDPHDSNVLLAFDDGTTLSVVYEEDGMWRIQPVHHGPSELTVEQPPLDSEFPDSDRATVNGPISWVVLGTRYAITR